MAFHLSLRSQSVSNPSQGSSLVERISEEPLPLSSKSVQSTVTCIYQTNVTGHSRNVSLLWCKNLMNHTLNLKVDSIRGELSYTCKIDVKPWYFWNKKGYKCFEVDGNQMEVYWDLRSARFIGSCPEPSSDYYVALVSVEEVVLLLGDQNHKKKAYKRVKMRPSLVEALLLVKRESVFAKKTFVTKAKFDDKKKENDIVVESSTFGNKEPEMWISIDGIVLIHVKNLQWKFRGNQTIMVNMQPMQVFWDVHDWLFSVSGSGLGLFIFKPGPVEAENEKEACDSDDGSTATGYYSTLDYAACESCLVLYAHKLE